MADVERANAQAAVLDKKQRNFDKVAFHRSSPHNDYDVSLSLTVTLLPSSV